MGANLSLSQQSPTEQDIEEELESEIARRRSIEGGGNQASTT